MDPAFLRNVKQDDSEVCGERKMICDIVTQDKHPRQLKLYYAASVERIERLLKHLATSIGGGGNWDSTALAHLKGWTKIHSVSVGKSTVDKMQCQVPGCRC